MTRFAKLAHRLLSWTLIAALTLQPALATAQSITVQGSDTGPRPRVDTSLSGHPVLNISRPNATGVSHDIYTQFETGDTIVNNSAVNADTALGGFIEGNPNLSFGAEAKTWIGEVVGGSQTRLTGILEVAGPGLDLVLANEDGITCDGCGFYNTTRTTLTTGKPVFGSDGSLSGFDVKRGYVQIGPGGLNPADRLALGDTSRVDVIARAAQLYGQMRAQEANIIAGANVVDYNWSYDPATGLASGITPQAGTGAVPALAIDTSALGGMYAGAIKLIATEAGVGVRMNGEMASAANISISVAGRITVGAPSGGRTPTVKAKKKVRVRAAGPIVLEGAMASEEGDQVQITSWDSGLTVVGEVTGGAIELRGAGLAAIRGAITARTALKITSESNAVEIGGGADLKAETLEVTAASNVTLAGVASASGSASLTAGQALRVASTGALGARDIALSGSSVDVAGLASAASSLGVTAGTGGAFVSGRALADRFTLRSGGAAEITGTAFGRTSFSAAARNSFTIGASGRVESGVVALTGSGISNAGVLLSTGSLALSATSGAVQNSGSLIAGGALSVTGPGGLQNSGLLRAQSFDYTSAVALSFGATSQFVADSLSITAPGLANAGLILGQQTLALNATSGIETLTNTGVISGGQVTLTAAGDLAQNGVAQGTGALLATAQGTLRTGAASQTLGKTVSLEGKGIALAGRVTSSESATLTAGTDGLTSSADITASSLALTSAGNAQLGGVTDVTGTASLFAAGTLSTVAGSGFYANEITATSASAQLDGEMIAREILSMTSTGSAIISGVVAGKTTSLTAGADADVSGVLAGTDKLDVAAVGTATVTSPGHLFGQTLSITAGGISSAGTLSGGTLTASSRQDNLVLGGVVAAGSTSLNAARDLAVTGRLQSTGALMATAQGTLSTSAASQTLGKTISLTGKGMTLAGRVTSSESNTLTAGTDGLTSSADITAASLSATSTGDAELGGVTDIAGTATLSAAGTLSTVAGSGFYAKEITVTTNGPAATSSVGLAGEMIAGEGVAITSTGSAAISGVVAGKTASLTAGTDASVSGFLAGTETLGVTAAGTATTTASGILFSDKLTLTAGTVSSSGALLGTTILDVTSTIGALTQNGLAIGDTVKLTSAAALSHGGRSVGLTSFEGAATRALISSSASEIAGGTVTLSGATANTSGLISADDALTLSSQTGSLTNAAQLSGKSIALTGATGVQHDGILTAEDTATVVATTGNVATGATTAGGATTPSGAPTGIKARTVSITGDAVSNAGVIVSQEAATLTARTGAVSNAATGTVSAGTVLNLTSRTTPGGTSALNNAGLLLAATLSFATAEALAFGATSRIVADDLDLMAASLSNAGLLEGKTDLDLSITLGPLSNSGVIQGADVLANAAGAFTNSGAVQSTGALSLTSAGAWSNTTSGQIIGETVTASTSGGAGLTNAGLINGVQATLTASGALTNSGTTFVSALAKLQGTSVSNTGTLRGRDIRVDGTSITTGASSVLEAERDALLIAGGSLSLGGSARALQTLDARATGGAASVTGTLHSNSTKLTSSGALTLGASAKIIGQSGIDIAAASLSGGLDVTDFAKLQTNGNLKLALTSGALAIGAGQELARAGNLALSLGGDIANAGTLKTSGALELVSTGGDILNTEGKVLSGGAMVLSAQSGEITNTSGSIEAGGGLIIAGGDFKNEYRSIVTSTLAGDQVEVTGTRTIRNGGPCLRFDRDGTCAEPTDLVTSEAGTITGVAAADLPPVSCAHQIFTSGISTGMTVNPVGSPCHDLATDIFDTTYTGPGRFYGPFTGTVTWGTGSAVTTTGARPEVLVTGNIASTTSSFLNDAGLISATGNITLTDGAGVRNTGYDNGGSTGSARFDARRTTGTWGFDGAESTEVFDFIVSNVSAPGAGGGARVEGEILAAGNLTASFSAQDGKAQAGSSATVAPRNSTSVAATSLPALALTAPTPSLPSLPTTPAVGSVSGQTAAQASKAGVTVAPATQSQSASTATQTTIATPNAAQSLAASSANGTRVTVPLGPNGSGIILPVIARPGSFNVADVNTLIDQGATRLGSARSAAVTEEAFLTSNYMMDVDRLQYRDELLFNRRDGLPFVPGYFGSIDQSLLDQSYREATRAVRDTNFRGPGAEFLDGEASFGFTQDGQIRLSALTQERGAGDLTITGGTIRSSGGSFFASGALSIEANQSAFFTSARIEGASVALKAKGGDLTLAGTLVSATDDLTLEAGNDINVFALSESFESYSGNPNSKEGRTRDYGTKLKLSNLTAGGDFSAIAGNNLRIAATKVDAGGSATLEATSGDVLLAFASETRGTKRTGRRSSETTFQSNSVVTQILAGTSLSIKAGKDAKLTGTKLQAGEELTLKAENDIELLAAQNLEYDESSASSGNFLRKTETRDSRLALTFQGVDIQAGGNASVIAGNNLTTAGTTLYAGGSAKLEATRGKLKTGTYKDIVTTKSYRSESILGGLLGSTSDSTITDEIARVTDATAALDLKTVSGGDTELIGTGLTAGRGLSISSGGDLIVSAAKSNRTTDIKTSDTGLIVSTTTEERSNKDSAAYAQFKAGTGLSFDVEGETRIALYSAADAPRPDAASLLPQELLAIEGARLLEEDLANEYFYDETKKLSPAFKALVSIAVTQGLASIGSAGFASAVLPANAPTWALSAVDKFAVTFAVESLDAAVSGDFDIGKILEGAAFAGVTAGLTSGINLAPSEGDLLNFNVNWGPNAQQSLFNFGSGSGLTFQNIAERTLDNTIRSGAAYLVYGTDFSESFKQGIRGDIIALATADFQHGIGNLGLQEGGADHVIAHALVGCGSAALLGGSCAAGAASGAVQSLYAGSLGTGAILTDADRIRHTNNAELIGASAALLLSGGEAENVTTGASIARSGFENNYLSHVQSTRREFAKEELEACLEEDNCSDKRIEELRKEIEIYDGIDAESDNALRSACSADQNSPSCHDLVSKAIKTVYGSWYEGGGSGFGDDQLAITVAPNASPYAGNVNEFNSTVELLNEFPEARQSVATARGIELALTGIDLIGIGGSAAVTDYKPKNTAPNRGFGSSDEAFDAISDFRSTRTITDAQGGAGTVSITEINGQRYVGVNSTNFTDADRALSKQWEAELGIPAGPAGNFQRQTLYHAEANTLMKIYNDTGGQMPSNVTIYVDRIACSSCQNNLPNLVDAMGVQNLTIKLPDGRSALVTKDGFVGDWQ